MLTSLYKWNKKKIDSVVIKDFIDKIWESFEEGLYGLEKVVLECGIDLGWNWYQDVNHLYYIEESLVFFYDYREKDENNIKENKERVKKLVKKLKIVMVFQFFVQIPKLYKIYKENKEKYLNDFMNDEYENKINELKKRSRNNRQKYL